jgi:hypothetical protein
MSATRRTSLSVLAGIVALGCTFAVGAFAFGMAQPVAGADDAQVKSQVEAYFNLSYQITVVPADAQPGHLSVVTVTDLNQRLISELPKVMTGDELTGHAQAYKRYLAELSSKETVCVFLGGSVDRIDFDGAAIISGSSATISGAYAYHFDSYYLENGVRVPDGLRGKNSFTAQLNKQNGVWLVSSMSKTQLSVQPNYSVPPASSEPPKVTGPLPTKLPPPTTGTKVVLP